MSVRNRIIAEALESIYRQYHSRAYVDPDPLLFLYDWEEIKEREIVGLVAACLAYGRVAQILKSVSTVLDAMGSSPYRFVRNTTLLSMRQTFSDFRHRFANGDQMATLLFGIGRVIRKYGSMENCIKAGLPADRKDLQPGLCHFFHKLTGGQGNPGHLMPDPNKSSACKRLHLYLRWMVRSDEVDPGGWTGLSTSSLIIPLDTHIHAIGRRLGFTRRNQADKRTALEITDGFRTYSPEDPVLFDFSLSRLGIRSELDIFILPEINRK